MRRILMVLTIAAMMVAMVAVAVAPTLAQGGTIRTLPDEACGQSRGAVPESPPPQSTSPSPVIFGESEPGIKSEGCTLFAPAPAPL